MASPGVHTFPLPATHFEIIKGTTGDWYSASPRGVRHHHLDHSPVCESWDSAGLQSLGEAAIVRPEMAGTAACGVYKGIPGNGRRGGQHGGGVSVRICDPNENHELLSTSVQFALAWSILSSRLFL